MSLPILWFVAPRHPLVRLSVPRGLRLRRRHAARLRRPNDDERRVAINAIGPVWDGNEVWLIVAGAGMFAAFPEWYATMFSGFYLALVLVLVALIIRGVSFEFRTQRDSAAWRWTWDAALTLGSLLVPLLVGLRPRATSLRGVPIDAQPRVHRHLLHAAQPLLAVRRADRTCCSAWHTAPPSWRSRPRASCRPGPSRPWGAGSRRSPRSP